MIYFALALPLIDCLVMDPFPGSNVCCLEYEAGDPLVCIFWLTLP